MIDPPTDLEEQWREGNADVLPNPTAGPYGQEPYHSYHAQEGKEPSVFVIFNESIPAGTQVTRRISDRPEYWVVVGIRAVANTITDIWPYDNPSGAALEIGPSGHLKVPAVTDAITLAAVGAATSRVIILAVRGYDQADVTW